MAEKNEHAVIDRTQSFMESFFSDLVTFGWLSFCIWMGMGSKFWTLITGTMFFVYLCGKLASMWRIKIKAFTTKQELVDWADSLEWTDDGQDA